ncbi:hypothetical protein FDF74_06850 [Clostridium niameyense]|uniref:Uncharacterized protein n=1 Tax=Clostridium niameyense TaxID=1622073 RepID=A0A6M0RBJ0_9CLOT|nr:hypothetical protein [Clostridium niameyense]NEZ46929.1 hypothetical protein [Clostridium niameyense]
MTKNKRNNTIFYILGIIISGMLSLFLTYYYYINKSFKENIIKGNQCVNAEEYEEAIKFYKEGLRYKNNSEIYTKVQDIIKIKDSKKFYSTGISFKKEGKYKEAVDMFKKVYDKDKKRYLNAKNEIEECTRLCNMQR